MASSVEKRMALTCPFFSLDRLTFATPTFSESSFSDILQSAMTRSSRRVIGIDQETEVTTVGNTDTCDFVTEKQFIQIMPSQCVSGQLHKLAGKQILYKKELMINVNNLSFSVIFHG